MLDYTCKICHQKLSDTKCVKHPHSTADDCPYCDLCEHGVNRYMHCDACHINDDQSWRTNPLTVSELHLLKEEASKNPRSKPARIMPNRLRYYRGDDEVPLLAVLIGDYERLKAKYE